MRIRMKLFISILAVGFVLGSCKKDEASPEPIPSPAPTTSNIIGTWGLVKTIEANGDEDTSDNESGIVFKKDGDIIWNFEGLEITGTWEFINNKQAFRSTFVFGNDQDSEDYQILKLEKTILWLKDEDGVETHYVAK